MEGMEINLDDIGAEDGSGIESIEEETELVEEEHQKPSAVLESTGVKKDASIADKEITVKPSVKSGSADPSSGKPTIKSSADQQLPATTHQPSPSPSQPPAPSPSPQPTLKVNKDIIKRIESKVSLTDKAKIMGILTAKLTPQDINLLRVYSKRSMTDTNIDRIKNIIKKRVTEEEKEYLKEMFIKYLFMME